VHSETFTEMHGAQGFSGGFTAARELAERSSKAASSDVNKGTSSATGATGPRENSLLAQPARSPPRPQGAYRGAGAGRDLGYGPTFSSATSATALSALSSDSENYGVDSSSLPVGAGVIPRAFAVTGTSSSSSSSSSSSGKTTPLLDGEAVLDSSVPDRTSVRVMKTPDVSGPNKRPGTSGAKKLLEAPGAAATTPAGRTPNPEKTRTSAGGLSTVTSSQASSSQGLHSLPLVRTSVCASPRALDFGSAAASGRAARAARTAHPPGRLSGAAHEDDSDTLDQLVCGSDSVRVKRSPNGELVVDTEDLLRLFETASPTLVKRCLDARTARRSEQYRESLQKVAGAGAESAGGAESAAAAAAEGSGSAESGSAEGAVSGSASASAASSVSNGGGTPNREELARLQKNAKLVEEWGDFYGESMSPRSAGAASDSTSYFDIPRSTERQ